MFNQSLKPYTKEELRWMMACLKFEWSFMHSCKKNGSVDEQLVLRLMQRNQWEQVTLHWMLR